MFDILCSLIRETGVHVLRAVQIKDGIMTEKTFFPANDVNNIYSVSKSFTSAAAGILFDRGMLKLSDNVYDIFHSYYPSDCSEQWKNVTIEDVMTHRMGIERGFLDIDCEDILQYDSSDYLSIVLRAPLVYPAGSHFCYSDAAYYLMSRIIYQLSGTELCALLQKELFEPLHFQGQAWARCPMGFSMGATGLFLRTRDMAKFGQLYLDGGVYEGKRILSEEWVEQTRTMRCVFSKNSGYSLGFWGDPDNINHSFSCGGMLSQVINICRDRNRVIAMSSIDTSGKVSSLIQRAEEIESSDKK